MNKEVIVGVVSKHHTAPLHKRRQSTFVTDKIKQALFDNGAVAIGILPPKEEVNYIIRDNWQDDLSEKEYKNLIAQIALCDGIIFQGGLMTDNYECIIAKYCYDNNIPTLGICAGQNVVVRALGGTTRKIPNPKEHNVPNKDYVHSIKINRDSKFYNIVKTPEIMVNSRHKRTIKNCPNLDKVAFCDDGYPDVVESKDKNFYIGVRFHPESLYKTDKKMNNIFKFFIKACRQK